MRIVEILFCNCVAPSYRNRDKFNFQKIEILTLRIFHFPLHLLNNPAVKTEDVKAVQAELTSELPTPIYYGELMGITKFVH